MNTTIIFSVGGFLLILTLLVVLRARSTRLEVKPSDVVVAVVPVVVFLLVTGKLQKLEITSTGVDLETATTAIVKAATSEVQVTQLPYARVSVGPKGGEAEIPEFVQRKTEGLVFMLGGPVHYDGAAIQHYLLALTRAPFLKYLIFEEADGSFLGMSDARALAGWVSAQPPLFRTDDLADWLNNREKSELSGLPGFIAVADAVNERTDNATALQLMETLQQKSGTSVDTLPVVNSETKKLVGIVNRSRLTASLLIDVSKTLVKNSK
jgi:hypothetical protein